MLKKVIIYVSFLFLGGCFFGVVLGVPTFNNFTKEIEGGKKGTYKKENLGISGDNTLGENIKHMFYPRSSDKGGALRDVLRTIGVGIFIVFLIRGGILMVFNAGDDSQLKQYKTNFLYILYGAFLFFGVTWLIGDGLGLTSTTMGTKEAVENIEQNILFTVLSFLKAMAFFLAIVMIMYYGFRVIQAFDNTDKIKESRKGVLNVILALVFIKIIDFVYYIAQNRDFKSEAIDLLVDVSRVLGFVLGALMVLSIFYAGILMITARGDEEQYKKGKNVILTVFLVSLVVMLFLLIFHQVLTEIV